MNIANLFDDLPDAERTEAFNDLLSRPGVRIERIVSHGQATPEDSPMAQDWDEWIVLLAGAARLRIEGDDEIALRPGDHLLIEQSRRHWVTWTDTDCATIWLAVHIG